MKLTQNIIGNNCIPSQIRTIHNMQHNNPFAWNVLQPNDIITLLQHFDEINFLNDVKPITFHRTPTAPTIYGLNVDNTINIYYPHAPKTNNLNIQLSDTQIHEHILQQYIRRTNRMIQQHITPTFIISSLVGFVYTKLTQQDVININDTQTKYNVIFALHKDYYDNLDVKNKVLTTEKTMPSAQQILKQFPILT